MLTPHTSHKRLRHFPPDSTYRMGFNQSTLDGEGSGKLAIVKPLRYAHSAFGLLAAVMILFVCPHGPLFHPHIAGNPTIERKLAETHLSECPPKE